jgi:hypothetical protein
LQRIWFCSIVSVSHGHDDLNQHFYSAIAEDAERAINELTQVKLRDKYELRIELALKRQRK